jgi:phenylacetate-CoA ligase
MKSLEDYLYPLLNIYNKSPRSFQWMVAKCYNLLPERKRLGSSLYDFEELIKTTEFNSEKDNWEMQNKFFLETIEVAKRTDFYPQYYKNHGIDINDIKSLNDINKLPFITKDTLQIEGKNLIVREREKNSLYITTGGSSGTPTGLYYQKNVTRGKELAFIENIWKEVGYTRNDRSAIFRGKIHGHGNENSLIKFDYVRNWLHLSSFHLTEDNLDKYIEELRKFKPKFIQGFPSALTLLSKLLIKNKIDLGIEIKGVFAGSENITKDQILLIEKAFKTKLITWYGHSEVAVLGGFCHKNKQYHIFPQYGYTEIIDNDDNIITEGTGEIVGTNFHNNIFPMIRFKTRDIAKIATDQKCCGCSRNYLLLEDIEGRDQEYIVADNNRLISLSCMNMHDKTFNNVKQFQFVQDKPAEVLLKYSTLSNKNEINENQIINNLTEKIGDNTIITVQKVENIPLTKRGKQVTLVQKLNIEDYV